MKTLHLGPEEILVAAKIGVDARPTPPRLAETIDRAEVAIREAEPMVPRSTWSPTSTSEDHVPAARPARPGAPSH